MSEKIARDYFMGLSASKNKESLEIARALAIYHANIHDGTCSIEDVRRWANLKRINVDFSGNWVGSIFKQKHWEYVGMVQSVHSGGHARRVCLWRLRGDVSCPTLPNFTPKPYQMELIT